MTFPAGTDRHRVLLTFLALAAGCLFATSPGPAPEDKQALPGMVGRWGGRARPTLPTRGQAKQMVRQASQAEAYQARLGKVRERLKARLRRKAEGEPRTAAGPAPAQVAGAPEAPASDRAGAGAVQDSGFRTRAWKPGTNKLEASPFGVFRFLFLALTLSQVLPCVGADIFNPVPLLPELDPYPVPALDGHVLFAAEQTGLFNRSLDQILAQPPRPLRFPGASGSAAPSAAAAVPDGPGRAGPAAGPAPAAPTTLVQLFDQTRGAPGSPSSSVAALNGRLALFRQWLGQAAATAGAAPATPFAQVLNGQFVAVETLAAGVQTVTTGYLAGILTPAEAIRLIDLASDTILNIVNSFRVAAQTRAMSIYAPSLERLGAQLNATRAAILADRAKADLAMAIPLTSTPPAQAPGPVLPAERRQACCDYSDLVDQYGIRQVIGAAGAANVAAYIVAAEAAAEILAVDAHNLDNATLPAQAREVLAAADLGAVTAWGLGSAVLIPAAGTGSSASAGLAPFAWNQSSSTLAARCAPFRCDNPITRIQAEVAGETLAGSIMNLVGYILYSTAVQISVAMEVQSGNLTTVRAPAPARGQDPSTAWMEGLMRQLRRQALAAVPGERIAALLDTVPAPGAAGPAFSGLAPGLGDAELFQSVMSVITRTVQQEQLPALAGSPGPGALAGVLSSLHQLAAAGQEQRGLAAAGSRTPASEAPWRALSSLAACSKYAIAVSNGTRIGIIDAGTASTLLKDIADTLQALVYGWLAEASAVPVEVSLRFEQDALPQLSQAGARIMGLEPPSRTKACQDCCHLLDLENLQTAQLVSRDATRTLLAAYIEALTGSAITETLDGIALARALAPVMSIQAAGAQEAGATTATGAGSPGPALTGTGAAATPGAGATATAGAGTPASVQPPPPLAASASGGMAACASCVCDPSSSEEQIRLAGQTLSGSGLTLFAYTLNLVVKAFRIVLAS